MNMMNLSPEEILKRREIEGGLAYDETDIPVTDQQQVSESVSAPPQPQINPTVSTNQAKPISEKIPSPSLPKQQMESETQRPTSFGKSQTYAQHSASCHELISSQTLLIVQRCVGR
jgi:hypothetical protein